MGVINITPDSFSDGGEYYSTPFIQSRLQFLNSYDAIDIGAESTAPMNSSLSWRAEWERWQMVLPLLKDIHSTISIDSYHPETVFELVKYCLDHRLKNKLIWNDVSGKFDEAVKEFLTSGHDYVFCHNLAPSRDLTGQHMNYVQDELNLDAYFAPFLHPQVIFDPCIGFSKTFEQNWQILNTFGDLQNQVGHNRWLLGFSRKSCLRKKYGTDDRESLDHLHVKLVNKIIPTTSGELWIRTHRPELLLP